jgi:hypothetical protein
MPAPWHVNYGHKTQWGLSSQPMTYRVTALSAICCSPSANISGFLGKMAKKKTHTFRSDFLGRIRNISLSPSGDHALAPLFEAINNSIQAFEGKFGKDNLTQGNIQIEVLRPAHDDGKPIGFVITDNGIGFNPDNLTSFCTSDSRYKMARGGKGVGRFLWLKVFKSAQVESTYSDNGTRRISFDFVAAEDE